MSGLSVGPGTADYYLCQLPVSSSPSDKYVATVTIDAFAFIGRANGVEACSTEMPVFDELAKIAPDFYKTLDSASLECSVKHQKLCEVRRDVLKNGMKKEEVELYAEELGELREKLTRVSEELNINGSRLGRVIMECMFVISQDSPVFQDLVALARGNSIPYVNTAPRPFLFDPDLES